MKYPKVHIEEDAEGKNKVVVKRSNLVSYKEMRVTPERRTGGILEGKGLWLDKCNYDWQIVEDDQGELVLIAIRKGAK